MFVWTATRVLNAVPKFSVNDRVAIGLLDWLLHWPSAAAALAEVLNPLNTTPTVGVEFVTGSVAALLTEIKPITGFAPAAGPPFNTVALTRTLVILKVRKAPTEAGGRMGIPKKVTELLLTIP